MKISRNIFKDYDIRGKYPKEINTKISYLIGYSLAKILKKDSAKIAIGRDLRKSSGPLAESFIHGTLDAGKDVIDIGRIITPVLYFATNFLNVDAGVMITASHNPKGDNGIKIVIGNEPLSGKTIEKIISQKIILAKKKGIRYFKDISRDYLEESFSGAKISPKIRLVLRSKDITAKLFIKDFLKKMQIKEGRRPHFHVSFDFDADRISLSLHDKNLSKIRGDILGAIIGGGVAQKGDIIIYDLRCSKAVPEYFRNRGIKAIPSKVGHYNIKKLMRERKAVFGLEITGHYYFKKFHNHENPFFGLRIFLEQLSQQGVDLKRLTKPLERYFHSGIINFPSKNPKELIKKLSEEYLGGSKNFLDGLTIEYSNWWFNIRHSHTEPLMRLVIEAKRPDLLSVKKKELLKKIKKMTKTR
ncbi:MAG: hypothetical protein AB1643_00020 [Patescibacteria group bacterium]